MQRIVQMGQAIETLFYEFPFIQILPTETPHKWTFDSFNQILALIFYSTFCRYYDKNAGSSKNA